MPLYEDAVTAEQNFAAALQAAGLGAEGSAPVEGTPEPAAPEAPETVEEPTGDPTPEPVAEERPLLAGKYKSVEDLEAAHQELQKKLGELGNEVGELRPLREQFNEFQTQWQQQQQQPQPITQDAVNYVDELVQSSPQSAAAWAAQSGQPWLYDRVIRQWAEYDPIAAGRYDTHMQLQQAQTQLAQQFAPQMQSAAELADQQKTSAALNAVVAKYPDFASVADKVPQLVEQRPHWAQALASQNVQERTSVLEDAYLLAKAAHGDTLQQAAQAVQQEQDMEARQLRQDAQVASATVATGRDPEPDPTPQQRFVSSFNEAAAAMGVMGAGSGVLRTDLIGPRGQTEPPPQ